MDVIYQELEGSDGCELCQAYSSDSYTSLPAKPHKNCECNINTIEMVFDPDEENPDVDVRITQSVTSDTNSEEHHVYTFSGLVEERDVDITHNTIVDYEEISEAAPEIEEHFDLSEARSSLSIDIDESQTLAAGYHELSYRVHFELTSYRVVYSYTYKDNEVWVHSFSALFKTPVGWEVIWDSYGSYEESLE